jgi:hypothetical protein
LRNDAERKRVPWCRTTRAFVYPPGVGRQANGDRGTLFSTN